MSDGPLNKITTLAKQLFAAKRKKKKLCAEVSEINKLITKIATGDLAKAMEDAEQEKTSITGEGTVYMKDEVYVNVKKEDRGKLYLWLRETKNGALIQDWVFPQTLLAFFKEQLKKGKPLPDFIKPTYVPTAKTRAAGAKGDDDE